MTRFLRTILGAATLTAGLAIGATQALAASSATSALSLTVSASVSLTGVPATGSATLVGGAIPSCGYAAGPVNALTLGSSTSPITVSSNDALGEHVTVQAANANFVGTASASSTFADNLDSVKSTTTFTSCNAGFNLSTTAQTLLNFTTGAANNFGIDQEFSIPGTQTADVYTQTITVAAIGN